MPRIKVTDDRFGSVYKTGLNGRFFELPVNRELEVEDALVDHLSGLDAAFDIIEGSSKRASAAKEGSVEALAPIVIDARIESDAEIADAGVATELANAPPAEEPITPPAEPEAAPAQPAPKKAPAKKKAKK